MAKEPDLVDRIISRDYMQMNDAEYERLAQNARKLVEDTRENIKKYPWLAAHEGADTVAAAIDAAEEVLERGEKEKQKRSHAKQKVRKGADAESSGAVVGEEDIGGG